MKTPKLSRKQLTEALDTVPISAILGREATRGLTAKQKKFALEVAKGNTKAGAYRAAYDVTSKATMTSKPYELARDGRIQAEIDAIQAAIRAQEYQTPSSLRALVINSLVKVITDPDSKPGQIVNAAKVLGNVTEVAAFTDRREVRTISTADDARMRIMNELRSIVKASADDATIVDSAADSLLAELAGEKPGPAEPTHPAPPQGDEGTPGSTTHTIPHERSSSDEFESEQSQSSEEKNLPNGDPTPLLQNAPPADGT